MLHTSNFRICWMQFCSPQQRLCWNLSVGVKKWSSYHRGILRTQKFYFLVNLRTKGGCMTELQINFTVFTLASFPFSQGLCFLGDWALHSFLSLLHAAHGQQMLAACVPGWYWYGNTPALFRQMWLHFRVWQTHLWPGPPAFDNQHIPAACSQWN